MMRSTGIVACFLVIAGCAGDDATGPSTPEDLHFTVEPTSVGVGSMVSPAIAVAVRDGAGETVWTWTEPVSVVLESNVPGAVLEGTTTVAPVGGTAVFDDLRVSGPGSGFRLVASSGALEEASSPPFAVHDVFHAAAVTSGRLHTCALTEEGVAYCWGGNAEGQLGDGTVVDRALPAPVATELRFVSLTSGANHTCALTVEGEAHCWGSNRYGPLGASAPGVCGDSPCSLIASSRSVRATCTRAP